MYKWTLFLDRDGVINKQPKNHYVMEWNEFFFRKGSLSAIGELNAYFQTVCIITNQQGVGKALMSEKDLQTIHARMEQCIQVFGGKIDAIQACTDLASDPNHRRKPRPDMALELQQQLAKIDFEKSVMVGDQSSDMEFGKNLGMKCVLIRNKEKNVSLDTQLCPDHVFDHLIDFVQFLNVHHEEFFSTD